MSNPLVSIICLCHNHEKYVREAIYSAVNQKYENIELIVVDDGSSDGSKNEIKEVLEDQKFEFIDLDENIGNCKAFNLAYKKAKGMYFIDLAADDLLLPDRVRSGLDTFNSKDIGVEFCNVLNVQADGNEIGLHFNNEDIPEGDLHELLIKKYFISPPGMMIKRDVLEKLNGYDESLSYEDFDFWIRSSRSFEYGYTNQVLVKKRILDGSLSSRQFRFRSKHQKSTLKVCQKIKELNQSKSEDLALRSRCFYEIKQCLRQGNVELIPGFLRLL